jgi:predicted DNA-binding transcriptional regulator AlpA
MTANKPRRPAPDSVRRDTAASRRVRAAAREADPAPEPSMLTVDQFCAELIISRSTFYDWRAKGRAPECTKLPNGELRILRVDYEQWLKDLRGAA